MRELIQWLALGGVLVYPWLNLPFPNLVEAEKAVREMEDR